MEGGIEGKRAGWKIRGLVDQRLGGAGERQCKGAKVFSRLAGTLTS
jgi:hypothetical protein